MRRAKQYATGVHGLDHLLVGGLEIPRSGLVILIKGRPGSGKTTLALQMTIGALRWRGSRGEKVRYYTCEQNPTDIRAKIGKLRCSEPGDEGRIEINPGESNAPSSDLVFPRGSAALQKVTNIATSINMLERARLQVVDGLSMLTDEEQDVAELENLIHALRTKSRVGIVVYEPTDGGYCNLDFEADIVIELRSEESQGAEKYFLTNLCVAKSRYQQNVLGWHQYKIRTFDAVGSNKHEIAVFPSVHFRMTQHKKLRDRLRESKSPITTEPDSDEPAPVQNTSLLAKILGENNLKQGSCTVLLGPRRCWKTQLTFDFLRDGSRAAPRESGLLVSLIENQGRLVKGSKCPCNTECTRKGTLKYQHTKCLSNVHLLQMPPGCITANEFFDALEERLQDGESAEKPIQRLVFWDLAQLEYRFPLLRNDPMFLPGLMNYLKYSQRTVNNNRRRITSLFMGASNSELAKSASAMADNVIFCWPDRARTDLKDAAQNIPANTEGTAICVDRIEGTPGKDRLFFIDILQQVDINPDRPLKKTELYGAVGMMAAVQRLQGLSALQVPDDLE
jgi:KaiC/GvpD/RAD55 family RecA-like ATPase